MIGDDERNLGIQFTGLMSAEEVVKTMGVLADKKREAVPGVREVQAPRHAAGLGERADEDGQIFTTDNKIGQVPLGAHEKNAFLTIYMLIKVDDISPVFCDEGSDGAHETGLVGAVDEEDGGRHFWEIIRMNQEL